MKIIICTALTSLLCISAYAAQGQVLLETAINADSPVGALVSFRDAQCSYHGQLSREHAKSDGVATSVLKAVGEDTTHWYVAVKRRACDQTVEAVDGRVELPRPPARVGGSGIPPTPIGYQPGTRFDLRKN